MEGLEILRDFSFVRLAGAELAGTAAAFQRFASSASWCGWWRTLPQKRDSLAGLRAGYGASAFLLNFIGCW